jgi:hypothetical protein
MSLSGSDRSYVQTHQSKFHIDTLRALTERFSQIEDFASASKADREMWEYLAPLYSNLNKGIKGCRGRRIRRTPVTTPSMFSHHAAQYSPFVGSSQPVQQIPPTNQANSGYYGVSHPATYSLCNGTYSGAPSPSSTATFDEEQEQKIVFGHRIF